MTLLGHIGSYYAASANRQLTFPPLQGDLNVDVCIIGGGFTGLSSAIHLRERGYTVALIEAERVGWGASGRNGGHASTGQRSDQEQLEALVGIEHARELHQLSVEAVDEVCALIDRFQIDCDLKEGDLHVASKPSHVKELRHYADKMQTEYNQDVQFLERDELEELTSARCYYAGVYNPAGRHLHPLNYVLGLAAAADGLGAQIFEQTRALQYRETGGDKVSVTTANGTIHSNFLVLGCNGYLEGLAPKAAGKIMPINNYVLATEPLPDEVARSLIRNDACMSDTFFVINYWKLSGDNRLLFGGGETYTRRFPKDMKNFVRKYMLRTYPELENTPVDYAWGGTLAVTMNRMPAFGKLGKNVFYAHGYSGHGVTIATLAGKLIGEAVSGTAERFDIMATVPTPTFPGGTLLRWPGLVAGMAWYALLDRL